LPLTSTFEKGLGMDTIELRGKAEFCLGLLQQLWTDRSLADRLSDLAARYREAALRAEFGIPADLDAAPKFRRQPSWLRRARIRLQPGPCP
jgi:hypothetical protein